MRLLMILLMLGVLAMPALADQFVHLYALGTPVPANATAPFYTSTVTGTSGLINGYRICPDQTPQSAVTPDWKSVMRFQLDQSVAAFVAGLPRTMDERAALERVAALYRQSALVDSVLMDEHSIWVRYRGEDSFMEVTEFCDAGAVAPANPGLAVATLLENILSHVRAGDIVFIHGCGSYSAVSRKVVRHPQLSKLLAGEIARATYGGFTRETWDGQFLHADEAWELANPTNTKE